MSMCVCSAIEAVTGFPRFQHHIQTCITVLMGAEGAERFRWLNGCPSWCLTFLAPAGWTETTTTPRESNRNGIFLLQHEKHQDLKEMIDRKKISRFSHLTYVDYRLLLPKCWLNDELVDGYITLILSSKETVCRVLPTHFYLMIGSLHVDACPGDVTKAYVS
jgi:hypothetical protein